MSDWQYRLFFSVDLENSTRYKSASSKPEELFVWSKKFESFYDDFENAFSKECKQYSNFEKPTMWKLVGDEILYQCEIKDSAKVVNYVRAFQSAVKKYNEDELRKSDLKDSDSNLPELLCKGTIWGAGFPIRNRAIRTPLGQEDYLGIDIDIGFRLTKYSTSEKITVSLPVAYILDLHGYEGLRYYDKQVLKGVEGHYPIFWISSMSKNSPEASWERICTSRSIVLYSENLFVDDFSKPFIKPFIYQDDSKKCDEISPAAIRLKEKNDKLEEQTAYPEDTAVPESVDSSCENNGAIKNMREKFIK